MAGRGRRSSGAALAAAGLVLAAVGCSGEDAPDTPRHPVAAVVHELQEARADGDSGEICDRLARAARLRASEVAGGATSDCERDLERAFEVIADGGGWGEGDPPVVRGVDAQGGRATATIKGADGGRADVDLVKEDRDWKLAGFLGMPPREFERFEGGLRGSRLARAGSAPIEASDGSGSRCPDLRYGEHQAIVGGCVVRVSGKEAPIRLLTPFGELELAKCSVAYRMAVGPDGRTLVDHVVFASDVRPGCSEIAPCLTPRWVYRPWSGYLAAEQRGAYAHHMLICLRSRVALLGGELVTRLVHQDGRWRVEPSDRGATGLRIDGELTIAGDALDLHM